MHWIDRAFVALLALGGAGHLMGSLTLIAPGTTEQVWSLSGVVATAMIVAVNGLRWVRPGDRALALIGGVGALLWAGIAVAFGVAIHDLADFRVIWHALAALGVAAFAFRAALAD